MALIPNGRIIIKDIGQTINADTGTQALEYHYIAINRSLTKFEEVGRSTTLIS